jgi:hypothetical protein
MRSGELVLNGGSMNVEATARAITPSRGSHPGMVLFLRRCGFWLAVTMPDSWWIWVPVAVVILLLLWRQQSRRDFYVVQHLVS